MQGSGMDSLSNDHFIGEHAKEDMKKTSRRYFHPLRRGDTLLINLTRMWPSRRSRNPHERLANGVALWKLYDVLREIYSPHTAYMIFEEVKRIGSEGRIVEVSIYPQKG